MATQYPMPFLDQIVKTLAFEGGYVNDPDDPGGETNYGITKRSYPDTDIKNLTKDQAVAIYYADYWLKPHIDRLPDWLSGKVFDMGVNMGTFRAIQIMQKCCNYYLTMPISTDGVIGTHTIAAVSKIADTSAFLGYYRDQLVDYYADLVQLHPVMQKYFRGWSRRAMA